MKLLAHVVVFLMSFPYVGFAKTTIALSDIEELLQVQHKAIEANAVLRQVGRAKNKIYTLDTSEFQTFAPDTIRIQNEYAFILQQLKFGDHKRAVELAERAMASQNFLDAKTRLAFSKLKFEALRRSQQWSAAARYCGQVLEQFVDASMQSQVGQFSLSCAQTIALAAQIDFSALDALSSKEIDTFIYSLWNKRLTVHRLARNVFFSSVLGQYKRFDEALALLVNDVKTTSSADSTVARAYIMTAEIEAKKGRFDIAKDIFSYLSKINNKSRVIEREIDVDNETRSLAMLGLARLLGQHGDTASAVKVYDQALEQSSLKNDKSVLLESAVVLHALGQVEKSMERFDLVKDSLLESRAENTNFGIPEYIEVLSRHRPTESQAVAHRQINFVETDLGYLQSAHDRIAVMGQSELLRTGRAVSKLQDIYQVRSPFAQRLATLAGVVDNSEGEIRAQRLETLELLQIALQSEDVFAQNEGTRLAVLVKMFGETKNLFVALGELSLQEWSSAEKSNPTYTQYTTSLHRKMKAIFEDDFAKEVYNRRHTNSNGAFWQNVARAKQALEDNRALFIKLESLRVARELRNVPRSDAELTLRNDLQKNNVEIAELFREMALFRLQSKQVLSADDNAFARSRMRMAAAVVTEFSKLHSRAFARNPKIKDSTKARIQDSWNALGKMLGLFEREFIDTLDAIDSKKRLVASEVLAAIRQQDLQERDLSFVKANMAVQFQKLLPPVIDQLLESATAYKGRLSIAANVGLKAQNKSDQKEVDALRDSAEVRELWLKSLEAAIDDGLLR